ncbi:hypothetical protein Alg130_06681, partial [Pyrenophora tritici-repentis]
MPLAFLWNLDDEDDYFDASALVLFLPGLAHIYVVNILVNERAGSLSSLGLDVLTKPNELSA